MALFLSFQFFYFLVKKVMQAANPKSSAILKMRRLRHPLYYSGSTNCCISPVTKVSLVRFGTRKVRALQLPLSTMPKTHVPLENRPRLYLRLWPNIDSSISIVFPLPPNLMLPCRIFSEQISLSFRSNATTVRSDTPDSRDTFLLDSSIDHRKMMYSHLASDTLESSKMEPTRIDRRFLQRRTGHSQ